MWEPLTRQPWPISRSLSLAPSSPLLPLFLSGSLSRTTRRLALGVYLEYIGPATRDRSPAGLRARSAHALYTHPPATAALALWHLLSLSLATPRAQSAYRVVSLFSLQRADALRLNFKLRGSRNSSGLCFFMLYGGENFNYRSWKYCILIGNILDIKQLTGVM